MSTTPVETYPNLLPATAVIGDPSQYADVLDAESNKDFCRRFIETIFNQGELSLICDFMSPGAVIHEIADALGDCQEHSIEWMTDLTLLYRHAFPDLRFEIQDQLAEDDRVVTFLRMRGTHKNALMSIAASGREIDIAGIRVDRVVGGKIVESWFHLDALGMLRQLHALPALNRRPQKVAPVSQEATAGAKPVVGWNPVPALVS